MTPEEIDLCQRGLHEIVNSYGRLVAKNGEGRVVNSGSAVLVKVDGRPLIATADHVLELFGLGRVYLHVFRPWAVAAPGVPTPPLEFSLDAAPLMLPRGKILDVAALIPPAELSGSSAVNWFAAERHADALRYLRNEVAINVDPRLAAMIVGFPRFSRFEDKGLRIQAAGSIAIWAVLQQFADPPAILGDRHNSVWRSTHRARRTFPLTPRPCFERASSSSGNLCKETIWPREATVAGHWCISASRGRFSSEL